MSLSKNQIVLVSIGAVTVVGAAILGILLVSAFGAKSEAAESLESALDRARRLNRGEIAPTTEAIEAIDGNSAALADWTETSRALVAVGDRAINPALNEAAFKQQLVDEARELAKLPGTVDGRLVSPDFTFGFKDYIAGGVLPEREKLPQLQRQWGDVRSIVMLLAEAGVSQVADIKVLEGASAEPAKEKKPAAKRAKKAGDTAVESTISRCRYAVQFHAKPLALVRAFNALVTDGRFFIIDDWSFVRGGDMIADSLSGEKDRKPAASSGRRRRRGQAADAEAGEESEAAVVKKGVITDPALEAPFVVTVTLSTCDFGSRAAAESATNADDESEKEEE